MKSGLHGEPVGVPIRMSAKPVERRFSWGHITSFGGGLQLIDYVGKFLKLAPFGSGVNGANLSRISERFRIRDQAFDILN